jgi:CheY-like chemotaxis protein
MTQPDSDKSVLLVEDDPLTRGAMRMVLEWEGYQVSCAANGREALDLLRRGERPSLILLDIAMPVLDGRQFREEQEKDPALSQIPVVVVSGTDVAATVDAAAHVQKPFLPGELLEAIREASRRC